MWHPRAGLGADLLRLGDRRDHAQLRIGQHELRAVGEQRAPTLVAHRRRQAENQLVSACGRDLREADAGIARRRLDDRVAGLENSARLGVEHHAERRAVLDRARRLHPLELDPHLRHVGLDHALEASDAACCLMAPSTRTLGDWWPLLGGGPSSTPLLRITAVIADDSIVSMGVKTAARRVSGQWRV